MRTVAWLLAVFFAVLVCVALGLAFIGDLFVPGLPHSRACGAIGLILISALLARLLYEERCRMRSR